MVGSIMVLVPPCQTFVTKQSTKVIGVFSFRITAQTKFFSIPVEKYQTGCRTYNIQAGSFTPEQLVEENWHITQSDEMDHEQ